MAKKVSETPVMPWSFTRPATSP